MIPRLSSDLEHYLNTNRPPLEADIAKSREILRAAHAHVNSIDPEDASSIDDDERADTTKVIRDCQIILSPIRRLPLDVTRAILLLCLPTAWENIDPPDLFYNNLGSFNIRLVPSVLSHICGEWRSISLSTSPLWSHLTICIARDNTRFIVDEIFSRLAAQSHRWGKVFLKMDDAPITRFPHGLPLLQHSIIIPRRPPISSRS